MNAPATPSPGTVIDGRYELIEALDDRGLGETWKARDANFKNRFVAVKLLRALDPGATALPEDLARQLKASRALRHPNLLATVNQGVWQARPYMVQDLFTGQSLGAGLDQARDTGQRLPADLLSGLFDRVCAGIEAGHQAAPQPVLHLGLNPGCVLIHRVVGQDFDVRVMDQGIASWADPDPGAPARSARRLRSPAPEQFTPGARPGPATDVFALGALLREMLAAPPPPVSEDHAPRPAGTNLRRDDVPDAVWEVIDRATRPAPDDRFPTVAALRAAARAAWAQPVTPRASAPAPAPVPSDDHDAPPDLFKTAFLPGGAASADPDALYHPPDAMAPRGGAPASDLAVTTARDANTPPVDDDAATSLYPGGAQRPPPAAFLAAMAAAQAPAQPVAPVVRKPTLPPRPAPVVKPPEEPAGGSGRTFLAVAGLVLGMALVAALVLAFYRYTHR